MTLQQTKLAVGAAVIAAILGGSFALNRVATDKKGEDVADASEDSGVDIRQNRLTVNGGGGNGSSGAGANANSKSSKGKSAGAANANGSATSGLASIIDVATTTVMPIETEAQTRERERYEEAMRNKFEYRETDPDRVKPAELAPTLQTVTEEYGIPKNLLAAMMYVETGGTHRGGEHSLEAGYGVMNLRESNLVDTLGEGAALLGKTKEEVLYNQELNIEAAAALLKSYYNDARASGLSESEAWFTAVSTYSGRPDPELAAALANETAGWLLKGFELHLSDGGGDLVVPPNPNPPIYPKNFELIGMNPPTEGSGPTVIPGTIPPDAKSYSSAAGNAQVSP